MTGQAIIGSTDISNLIVDGSYKMDLEPSYQSWEDGNNAEHRIYSRPKIRGEFDVALGIKIGTTLSQFNTIINNATNNHLTTAAFYVTNKGTVEAVNAYVNPVNKDHILTADGSFIDIITVEVTER